MELLTEVLKLVGALVGLITKMLFNTSGKTKNEYVNEILSNDSFTNLKLDLIDLDLKIKAGDHFEVHYRGPVEIAKTRLKALNENPRLATPVIPTK